MTDPLETHGAGGASGASQLNQQLIWPHSERAAWGHWGQDMGPAPLAPLASTEVGPRNALKNKAGPAGPTGPTENDEPDIVQAVRAAFELAYDPYTRLSKACARVAALSDPDGVARTPEAIEAVWDWAEAHAGPLKQEQNIW